MVIIVENIAECNTILLLDEQEMRKEKKEEKNFPTRVFNLILEISIAIIVDGEFN
jgi:hypothetical protein